MQSGHAWGVVGGRMADALCATGWRPPQIHTATMNLVNSAYQDCVEVLEAHQAALDTATEELLREEQITGERLEEIMKVRLL